MFRLIILIFLFSWNSQASTFLGVGASARLEKGEENEFETKFPILIYGGFADIPWAYALEGLYYKDKSDSGPSLQITNYQYEGSAYVLRFVDYREGRAINPYLVAGLGAFRSHVTTIFNGAVDKDRSTIYPIAKLGAGAWAQLGSRGFVNLEGKAMYSTHFSPELIFEASGRVGLEF